MLGLEDILNELFIPYDFDGTSIWVNDRVDLGEMYCPQECLQRQFVSPVRGLTIILASTESAQAAQEIVDGVYSDFAPAHYEYTPEDIPWLLDLGPNTWAMLDRNSRFTLATSDGQVFILVRLTHIPGSDDGIGQAMDLVGFARLQIDKIRMIENN